MSTEWIFRKKLISKLTWVHNILSYFIFEIKLYELNKIRDVKKNKTMLCIRIGTDIYALEQNLTMKRGENQLLLILESTRHEIM